MSNADLQLFKRTFGELGATEQRSFPLARAAVKNSGDGSGRLKISGHAAVFNSPSVEMASPFGTFVERISPHAFDNVLARNPSVILTWDHLTHMPLARTNGTLELSVNAHGLRFYAVCSRTSYAEDLRNLMADGIVSESSFLFSVAKGGETWEDRGGQVLRTIHEVGNLYDVCVTVAGAYPATDSGIARSLFVDYALQRNYLRTNPDVALRAARLRADIELRRRRLSAV